LNTTCKETLRDPIIITVKERDETRQPSISKQNTDNWNLLGKKNKIIKERGGRNDENFKSNPHREFLPRVIEVATVEAISSPTPYVRVKVRGKEIYAKGFIDTGNSCKNSLINEDFFYLCGGEFLHSHKVMLNTAAQGEGLPVLGQAKSIKIYLEGINKPFIIKPLVVRGLTHPINLGMSYLQSHHCELKSSPMRTILKFGRQSARLVSKEDPVMPGHSTDIRFSKTTTGYASLGNLTMFQQRGRVGKSSRQEGSRQGSRRENDVGGRTSFEEDVFACSERTEIPAGHLKFVPVKMKGTAYSGTVQTEANICDWTFIPRGLYNCHRGKTLIAIFNPTDDVIDIRPHKILVNVTPVAEEDMAHTKSDVNNMMEQKEFTH